MGRGRPKGSFNKKVPDEIKEKQKVETEEKNVRIKKDDIYYKNLGERMSIHALAYKAEDKAEDKEVSNNSFWKKVYFYLEKIADMDPSQKRTNEYLFFKENWNNIEMLKERIKE